jgi:hypothetical protein
MSSWRALDRELEHWQGSGRSATLWWRDDDAVAVTPALQRMTALSDRHAVPLALASIPATFEPALAEWVAQTASTWILQHGYAHANHAPSGEKAAEFGAHRPWQVIVQDVVSGLAILQPVERFLPVFVPPWNRIAPAVVAALPGLGFRGLSCYGPRESTDELAAFTRANTHADIIAWRMTRGFVGVERVLTDLVDHLAARRLGSADAAEPTGLLTHHLVHDEACWSFLGDLFARTADHPAVRWLSPQHVFAIACCGVEGRP